MRPQRVFYPKNATAGFTNIHKQLKAPFVGYADFESFLRPESDEDVSIGIAKKAKKEVKYQNHVAASYFTKFVTIDPDFDLPLQNFPQQETYVGEDAAEHFLDYAQQVADSIFKKYINKPKELVMSEENRRNFQATTECHICGEALVRAMDHCHNKYGDETSCEITIIVISSVTSVAPRTIDIMLITK